MERFTTRVILLMAIAFAIGGTAQPAMAAPPPNPELNPGAMNAALALAAAGTALVVGRLTRRASK